MTWLPTSSGRPFDLIHPSADDVDFAIDIAEGLARIPRFTGTVRSGIYSVAQHCVEGAHAIMRETKRRDIAAAFLLHDAREAYINDLTTPFQEALAAYGGLIALNTGGTEAAGIAGKRLVESAFKLLGRRLDAAIYEAAGIIFPLPDDVRGAVKLYDLRMLATEKRHLLAKCEKPWNAAVENAQPIRLEGKLKVWPWAYAADAYRSALDLYVPTALRRAA